MTSERGERREVKRRWRDYRTAAGRRPVKDFFDQLSDADAAAVVAAMQEVRQLGLAAARHLRGDIYEARAEGDRQIFRVLFATEGRRAHCSAFARGVLEEDAQDAAGEDQSRGAKVADWHRRARPRS